MTAPYEENQPTPPVGRASVPGSVQPVSPAAGRASVPVSPAPVRTSAPPAGKPGKRADEKPPKAKKTRRRNRIIAAVAALILLSGVGLIAGVYFYDNVPEPKELSLKNSTEIYDINNQPLARLGGEYRAEVPMSKLKESVQRALVAGEDKNFWEHHGIDPWGIARAAWNNVTGGELQGASTITQQYARHAAADMEITYARKVREAAMARKLEDEYDKTQILGFYLNTVYFGRGAHGIGAAAEAYFGISPDKIDTMTVEQAAVLGAVLRQPEPETNGDKGYDPHYNPGAAQDRWKYVLGNMVEMNWLSQAEKDAMRYPEVKKYTPGKAVGEWGYTDAATGHIVKYVEKELAERGVLDYLKKNNLGNWKTAGLRIQTSIDKRMQTAIEAVANRQIKGSTMSKQRPNIVGAVVSIDPHTGRVIGYYAGTNTAADTDWAAQQHPPASSFKIYTLAAAFKEKISASSRWDPTEMKTTKGDKYNVGNANREGDDSCGTSCTLEEMTVKSFNVPFFKIADEIGPEKVVKMAHDAGVQRMWNDQDKAFDLNQSIPGTDTFGPWVGFGQYGITVLDHAVGTATMANHGVYNKPHFVVKVERKNRQTGKWDPVSQGDEKLAGKQTIDANIADEVTGVLKKVTKDKLDGRQSAGKTGTWENGLNKKTNSHAWFTGYSAQISTTVWLGSLDNQKTPIKMADGKALDKAANMGSAFAKDMWEDIMEPAHKTMQLEAKSLPGIKGIGDENKGDGTKPTPTPQPTNVVPSLEPTREPDPTPTPEPTGKPTPKPTPSKTRQP